jgi:membrane protease YdiL (CAAX protease family)
MRELFFRSLSPSSQFVFLLFICFSSFLLFSALGNLLVSNLYGLDFQSDPHLLRQYNVPYVVAANKVLLFFQHIGLFILPALVFNQVFSFRGTGSFLFWGIPVKPARVLLVIVLMIFALPVINYLVTLNGSMQLGKSMSDVERAIRAMEEDRQQLTSQILSATGWGFVANILVIAVIPPIGEEFIFRGVLQKLLARWYGNVHLAIWLSAFFFSALHFEFYGFLPRLMLGVMFGYIVIWTGSVWYAVIAHFMNNMSALAIAWYIGQGEIPASADSFGSDPQQLLYTAVAASVLAGLMFWLWKTSVFPQFRFSYVVHPRLELPKKEEEEEPGE